ncbi:MAG: type II toxin-antitoxin system VapC family toxin [Candidatus Bathyarchaeota archaeon]|nr:type II toxin-antitoxin system VapC family toxin [Candidatus Bathyarchaeota archaeon]MDH5790708.1 type II toxin-antitoxin system VapC family toxin [Candidatus Bathyarchaeota archaeon]
MAREEVVVADASVVVKWFVEEEHTRDALRLRDDYVERVVDIASPGLLPYEVLNALRYNPSLGEVQLKDAATALEKYSLWLFPLEGELAARCVENSLKHGISVYDSAYISLGEVRGSPVYTADRRLVEKVGGENLRHISSY